MAAKKGAGKKRRRWGWKVALALILLLALGLAGLYGASRVVHVRYATAWLRDLPPAFEGATILFVSDLDIRSGADARAAAGIDSLPGSLEEAIKAMQEDQLILDTLGEHVAANYIEGKMKEWDDYRTQVTDWELARYMIAY